MGRSIISSMFLDLVRDSLSKTAEIFVEDPMYVQILVHADEVTQSPYRSTKKNSVEPRQDTDDAFPVSFDETFHVTLTT